MKTRVKHQIKAAIESGDATLIAEAKKNWPVNFPRVEKSLNAKKEILEKRINLCERSGYPEATGWTKKALYERAKRIKMLGSEKQHSSNGNDGSNSNQETNK